MNLKEYIASGVAELYAMGALSPEEKTEFDQKVLVYPELKEELVKAQSTLEKYTFSAERNPRPSLRTEILGQLNSTSMQANQKQTDPKGNHSHSLTYKYLIAACLAALVISTFASWFFYSRWDEAEDRNLAMMNEEKQLNANYLVVKNSFDKAYSDLMMMRDENAKVVMLMATDSTKKYQARVYWNKYTREAFIDVLYMPEPEAGKQYQLWAMADGQAIDAGVFNMGLEEGMQRMKNIVSAQSWAVTLEPAGGSLLPSMDHMMLISKSI